MRAKIICLAFCLAMGCAQSRVVTTTSLKTNDDIPAKNVILMIGDGMGLSQISAGIYSSKRSLNIERFKHIGIQKTHCKDELVTDSAASATALARGIKANRNTFGTTNKERAPKSILEEVEERGGVTGLTTTSSITHATPAAFLSYQYSRSMYEEIATDFMKIDVDYIVGGGKKYFDRREIDSRDLIAEMIARGYRVKSYLDGDFREIYTGKTDKFTYFTSDAEPLSHQAGRDYFIAACVKGTEFLKDRSDDKGFFYMIESSQIDWGGHANVGDFVIDELLEFDKVIGKMLDFAEKDGETLLLVTADHETGGFSILQKDKRGDLIIGFNTKNHTATTVPVFAFGPGAELFQGIYDNTEIHTKMRQALHYN